MLLYLFIELEKHYLGGFVSMGKGKIGVQMSTIKDQVKELGVYETMKKLNDLDITVLKYPRLI